MDRLFSVKSRKIGGPSPLTSQDGMIRACRSLLALSGKYCAGDTVLFSRFRQSFERRLIEMLNDESESSEDHRPRLIKTIEAKGNIEEGLISAARPASAQGCGEAGITVQALIESVSLACFKALAVPRKDDSENHSHSSVSKEIVEALFYLIKSSKESELDEGLIFSMLCFNTDRDRLELELRLQLIAVLVDGQMAEGANRQTIEKLKPILELLAQHFGKKFCFKCHAIIKEVMNH